MNQTVWSLMEQYKGTLPAKIARHHQVNPNTLKRMEKKGLLEKDATGIYTFPGQFADEFFALQQRFTKGIFSHETALFLHGLSDENIGEYVMTFPYGYHNPRLGDHFVIQKTVRKERYGLGTMSLSSPAGNPLTVYNLERTLCDLWHPRHEADQYLKVAALKRYMKCPDKDLFRLAQYAKQLGVGKELATAVEVLRT